VMEVHELKEVIEGRFDLLDKRLDKMDEKVTSHDRWLWLLRGVSIVVIALLSVIGVKVRF
jgi:hypothetical protein